MDMGDCIVVLKPRDEWVSADSKAELIEQMKEKISVVPGVNYEFTQPIEMRFNELLTGVREDIAIKLYGEDLQVLADKAEAMGRIIATVEGVGDMKVEATTGLPQMTIHYRRDKLAQYGLTVNALNRTVETAFAGGQAGVIFEGERRFDLVVRLDSAYRTDIRDVQNLYIPIPGGAQVPLREVADISYQPGPMQISRDNTNRRTYVGVNVRGRDVRSLVEEIQQKLDEQLGLPPGYYIRYGGAFENLERATDRLQVVVPIALFLIFVLIYFALRSFSQTLMIYVAIPLAAIGGVFSLWLRDMPFSISAGVGFIVLFGVAVLNGLVLISGWNELKEEGMNNLNERIRQGARRRIRPIMLTALTDILGFLPMALSVSAGAEVQRPLATVVIGGLITSTLLTLFILPLLYRWTETRTRRPVLGKGSVAVLLIVGGVGLTAAPSYGQSADRSLEEPLADSLPIIALEEAVQQAVARYPRIQAARLDIERQRALKKTAWNLGNTQLFTGGEEIGETDEGRQGVYTIVGIQQQNINVLGIASQRRAQQQRVALSEAALRLSEYELRQQVKSAYGEAYVARQNLRLYEQLDTIYREFERAARLRYEVEETSRLAYLAATNQVKQIELQRTQASYDYTASLYRLNLWLVSDTLYTVVPAAEPLDAPWLAAVDFPDTVRQHPQLEVARQQVTVAEADRKAATAGYFPQLNAQYGVQEVGGQSGYYQFQVGVSVPLFFAAQQGQVQAARVAQQVASQQYNQTRREVQASYRSLRQQYYKWRASWRFYQDEALPLAREQRAGAVLAYDEGAIDYVSFIQNLRETVQVEVQAQDALRQYLQTKFQLEYYLKYEI